jgi:DNA-binding transcriptional ArsR family regulator
MHGRTDAAIAVLTLSGREPTPEPEFFRKVYGFAYLDASHRGVLDVLVHRVRRRIDAGGTVVRSKGCLSLELQEAIAVADPRCSPPAAARILSALARQPLATAYMIAGRLGISVRAAQMALQQLVSDGACAVRRTGRQMEYQLQDSAFCEPTGNDVLGQR